jgi:hypothetical protein
MPGSCLFLSFPKPSLSIVRDRQTTFSLYDVLPLCSSVSPIATPVDCGFERILQAILDHFSFLSLPGEQNRILRGTLPVLV